MEGHAPSVVFFLRFHSLLMRILCVKGVLVLYCSAALGINCARAAEMRLETSEQFRNVNNYSSFNVVVCCSNDQYTEPCFWTQFSINKTNLKEWWVLRLIKCKIVNGRIWTISLRMQCCQRICCKHALCVSEISSARPHDVRALLLRLISDASIVVHSPTRPHNEWKLYACVVLCSLFVCARRAWGKTARLRANFPNGRAKVVALDWALRRSDIIVIVCAIYVITFEWTTAHILGYWNSLLSSSPQTWKAKFGWELVLHFQLSSNSVFDIMWLWL